MTAKDYRPFLVTITGSGELSTSLENVAVFFKSFMGTQTVIAVSFRAIIVAFSLSAQGRDVNAEGDS